MAFYRIYFFQAERPSQSTIAKKRGKKYTCSLLNFPQAQFRCVNGMFVCLFVCLFVCGQVLGTVATVLFQDHEMRHTEFQQLPYHRVLIMLLIELNQPEAILEAINFQVLQTFR